MGYSFTTIAFRVCLIEQLSQLDTLLQAATTSLNRHTHTHTLHHYSIIRRMLSPVALSSLLLRRRVVVTVVVYVVVVVVVVVISPLLRCSLLP